VVISSIAVVVALDNAKDALDRLDRALERTADADAALVLRRHMIGVRKALRRSDRS